MDNNKKNINKKEQSKLDKLSNDANKKRQNLYKKSLYDNLDVNILIAGIIQTLAGIFEDITSFGKREDDDIKYIFFKDDRMFFLGVICILITVLLMVYYSTQSQESNVTQPVAAVQQQPV
tara:strand:- start:3039 stop:3398 length:360 start_codon:yes stop_codon:yes gene_type:complete